MKKILFVTTFIVFNLVFSDFKSEIKRHYNNRIIDLLIYLLFQNHNIKL